MEIVALPMVHLGSILLVTWAILVVDAGPALPSALCEVALGLASATFDDLKPDADYGGALECRHDPSVVKGLAAAFTHLPEGASPITQGMVINAPDKAGSTSLRAFQGSTHPLTPGRNCSSKLEVARQRVGSRPATAMLVRDPFTRYVSGVSELIRHECNNWMHWRNNFYAGEQRRGLPLSTLHPHLKAQDLRVSRSGISCNATFSGTPAVWPLASPNEFVVIVGAVLTDMDRGFRDRNVIPQVFCPHALKFTQSSRIAYQRWY